MSFLFQNWRKGTKTSVIQSKWMKTETKLNDQTTKIPATSCPSHMPEKLQQFHHISPYQGKEHYPPTLVSLGSHQLMESGFFHGRSPSKTWSGNLHDRVPSNFFWTRNLQLRLILQVFGNCLHSNTSNHLSIIPQKIPRGLWDTLCRSMPAYMVH